MLNLLAALLISLATFAAIPSPFPKPSRGPAIEHTHKPLKTFVSAYLSKIAQN